MISGKKLVLEFSVSQNASEKVTGGAIVIRDASQTTLLVLLVVLSVSALIRRRLGIPFTVAIYLPYLWIFALAFTVTEFVSFEIGIWILVALCFLALREYFTLVDLRIQDRWGMLAAYLAIPFMFYFISIDWYGMFIISIPIWAFLVVPFAITLGGREAEGSVLSIGAIDVGLFLLVYCIGHIGYLTFYSTWMAVFLVTAVVVCDLFAYVLKSRERAALPGIALQILIPAPVTIILALALAPWTGIPLRHLMILALLIPFLVAIGCHTITHLETDLGIDRSRIPSGHGRILNSLKSFLYAAPVAFHYLRYNLDAW